jgi:hypothetical protein
VASQSSEVGCGSTRNENIGHVLTGNSAFKIQLKAMYIDSSLNSVSTILGNLYQSFYEAAVRCLEYVRVLSKVRTTCSSLLISKWKLFPIREMVARCAKCRCKVVHSGTGSTTHVDQIKRVHGYRMGDRG